MNLWRLSEQPDDFPQPRTTCAVQRSWEGTLFCSMVGPPGAELPSEAVVQHSWAAAVRPDAEQIVVYSAAAVEVPALQTAGGNSEWEVAA